MPRVAVIAHRSDGFWRRRYVLHTLIEVWKSWGIEVSLADSPHRTSEADLAILHVDETFVPPEYLGMAATYPRCVNRYTPDISKRFISRQLVSRSDGYDGPVIVKSNYNMGGWIEANTRRPSVLGGSAPRALAEYKVYDRAELVPDDDWDERSFVVEKFLPEIKDGLYGLRTWHFFGSADYVSVKYANKPIVKGRNAVKRERLDEVPEELRPIREELGFEYGKFDYAINEGKAVLYDVNRTPGYGSVNPEEAKERCMALAPGIRDFLQI